MTEEPADHRPVIVSGSIYSVASPPPSRPSPVHSRSPAIHPVEEENSDVSAQGSSQHHNENSVVDEPCIKVCVGG